MAESQWWTAKVTRVRLWDGQLGLEHRSLDFWPRELFTTTYSLRQWSPTFLVPETGFTEDSFPVDQGGGDGLQMIQAHGIYCAFSFRYYYISSTSDHQALDPGGWGPLV